MANKIKFIEMDGRLITHPKLIKAFHVLKERYGEPLGIGRHRVTFLSKNKKSVIKLPNCCDGKWANERELEMFKTHPQREFLAKCYKDYRLSKEFDTLVIRMEKVTPDFHKVVRKYAWANKVDMGQVGITFDGRLVAFDYAQEWKIWGKGL